MKTLRKTKKCLNCGQVLSDVYDYCPLCGQENTDNNVSFKQLIGDFFSSYFSLDSKFFRSFKPFLISPGSLTNNFNSGKRKSYANPVRLYIIISFFYFFILSFLASDFSDGIKPTQDNQLVIDSLENVVLNELDSVTLGMLVEKDSIAKQTIEKYTVDTESGSTISIDTTTNWPLSNEEWKIFIAIKDDPNLAGQQVFDSLHIEHKSAFTQHIVSQMIRVYKTDKEYVFAFVVKNFSLMMFLMLPVFALILKILYHQKKILYINHLVHSIHIHSFAFLIYGVALAISIWLIESDWINNLAFFLVALYSYLSFKTVYKQSHRKSFMKFFVTGILYSIVMLIAFVVELMVSFLLF